MMNNINKEILTLVNDIDILGYEDRILSEEYIKYLIEQNQDEQIQSNVEEVS